MHIFQCIVLDVFFDTLIHILRLLLKRFSPFREILDFLYKFMALLLMQKISEKEYLLVNIFLHLLLC